MIFALPSDRASGGAAPRSHTLTPPEHQRVGYEALVVKKDCLLSSLFRGIEEMGSGHVVVYSRCLPSQEDHAIIVCRLVFGSDYTVASHIPS